MHSNITLLANGREAFPEILRQIEGAKSSVVIHMFLWRADAIGQQMARAVLAAADRGVCVDITVDRYGLLLEACEESGASFFHDKPRFSEKSRALFLHCVYRLPIRAYAEKEACREMRTRILAHKNICVHKDEVLADHSKYYVIDERVLFLGGINIEDKENGCDLSGRQYLDYMVRLTGEETIKAFYQKTKRGIDQAGAYRFVVNSKTLSPKRFELYEEYLSIIQNAKEEILIAMAYFSALPAFVDALVAAAKRGVRVTVMLPKAANFQQQSNMLTAKQLLKGSGGAITILLSPKMVHAKVVCSENKLCLGSCNITHRAFHQLSELNVTVDNIDSPFCRRLLAHLKEEFSLATPVKELRRLRSLPPIGRMESYFC